MGLTKSENFTANMLHRTFLRHLSMYQASNFFKILKFSWYENPSMLFQSYYSLFFKQLKLQLRQLTGPIHSGKDNKSPSSHCRWDLQNLKILLLICCIELSWDIYLCTKHQTSSKSSNLADMRILQCYFSPIIVYFFNN